MFDAVTGDRATAGVRRCAPRQSRRAVAGGRVQTDRSPGKADGLEDHRRRGTERRRPTHHVQRGQTSLVVDAVRQTGQAIRRHRAGIRSGHGPVGGTDGAVFQLERRRGERRAHGPRQIRESIPDDGREPGSTLVGSAHHDGGRARVAVPRRRHRRHPNLKNRTGVVAVEGERRVRVARVRSDDEPCTRKEPLDAVAHDRRPARVRRCGPRGAHRARIVDTPEREVGRRVSRHQRGHRGRRILTDDSGVAHRGHAEPITGSGDQSVHRVGGGRAPTRVGRHGRPVRSIGGLFDAISVDVVAAAPVRGRPRQRRRRRALGGRRRNRRGHGEGLRCRRCAIRRHPPDARVRRAARRVGAQRRSLTVAQVVVAGHPSDQGFRRTGHGLDEEQVIVSVAQSRGRVRALVRRQVRRQQVIRAAGVRGTRDGHSAVGGGRAVHENAIADQLATTEISGRVPGEGHGTVAGGRGQIAHGRGRTERSRRRHGAGTHADRGDQRDPESIVGAIGEPRHQITGGRHGHVRQSGPRRTVLARFDSVEQTLIIVGTDR